MEYLTKLIQQEIKKKYKSVRKFASEIDVPQTTVVSAIKNGITGTGFGTVLKMCKALDIEIVNYDNFIIMNEDTTDLLKRYNFLDDYGKHTVRTVLEMEFARVASPNLVGQIAAQNGNKIKELNPDEEMIEKALQELNKTQKKGDF